MSNQVAISGVSLFEPQEQAGDAGPAKTAEALAGKILLSIY